MKRVLVTGAAGWIGRHCLAALIPLGFEIHAVSRRDLRATPAATTWHRADLLDPEDRRRVIEAVRPSHLLHLAWDVRPGLYRTAPSNWDWLAASIDLLDGFVRSGGVRAVGAGTCMEYDWSRGLCREDEPSPRPTTPYGSAKRALAAAFEACAAARGVSTAWGRVFFPYGPGEPPERLVVSVVRALLSGGTATCSEGSQVRDFIYVEELAAAFAALLDSDVQGPVNLASGQPLSIRAMVTALAAGLGAEDRVTFGGRAVSGDDAQPLVTADLRRLTEEVGWRPTVPLDEALRRTVEWWKEQSG